MSKRLLGGEGWSFKPAEKAPLKKNVRTVRFFSISIENRPGGKKMTLLRGLHYLGQERLEKLAHALKTACGTGGTVKDGAVELQGDRRDQVKDWLQKHDIHL